MSDPKASASASGSRSPKTPDAPNPIPPTYWRTPTGWSFAGQVSPTTKPGQDLKEVGDFVVSSNALGRGASASPDGKVTEAIVALMSQKTLEITTGIHINAILYLRQKEGYKGEIVVRDEEMKSVIQSLMPSFPAEKILLPGVPTAEDARMGELFLDLERQDTAEQHAEAAVEAELGMPLKKKMKMEDYTTEEMST